MTKQIAKRIYKNQKRIRRTIRGKEEEELKIQHKTWQQKCTLVAFLKKTNKYKNQDSSTNVGDFADYGVVDNDQPLLLGYAD